MSLDAKSQELKQLMSTFDTQWLLGDLSMLIHVGRDKAGDQLGQLSSPQRQLYYLAGLNVTSNPKEPLGVQHDSKKWAEIVRLLNEIEAEYHQMFFPKEGEEVNDEWKRVRQVAMPSFLGYFNQGPLNYEEQVINWIEDLFMPLNEFITEQTALTTQDFIQFYKNLDDLVQRNFQGHGLKKELLRENWDKYSKLNIGVFDEAPDFIKEMGEKDKHLFLFIADHGIKDRFYPKEVVSETLPIEKVQTILNLLSCSRGNTDFLYYTEMKPGNPLYDKPIVEIGEGLYQVFEVKQVIHAIQNLLENICSSSSQDAQDKYISRKGKLLEERIEHLFSTFFKSDYRIFKGYYVDGNEQDILFLWKKYAFIIEAKGYTIGEPFRNPEKAFVRIKRDFDKCIGYGYEQTSRVERKFINGEPLRITDNKGNLIEEIDTNQYEMDFSIIVNLESFGQVQCDLAMLLNLRADDDVFPWAVKLDDLEIFILTLMAQKKSPMDFIYFLEMRENLHDHLICSDELEICGAFLGRQLNKKNSANSQVIITTPDLGDVFDKQYFKGMGFKNERLLKEKHSGKYIFW